MPPRSTPTARQRRLGAELRRLRDRAGLSSQAAGALLGADQTRISNIEAGRVGISEERLRSLACNYQCSDGALIDALVSMLPGRRHHWWDEYRVVLPDGFRDVAELEHFASRLRTGQIASLPGQLQTVDHARVVFRRAVPALPPHEIEHRVSHRIKRQEILHGKTATPYTAIIHEAALRMEFGGRDTTRAQLRHVLEASERENVIVRVIPFSAGAYPGAGQVITYASGPVPELDTVCLDAAHGPELIHAEAQLAKYRTILDQMEEMALGRSDSRDFVQGIIKDI